MSDADETQIIARRSFTLADQQSFASWSGDYNPMHLDAVAARRTTAGAPVVHGIHALLWAYDAALHHHPRLASYKAANVTFKRFIHLDQAVECLLREEAIGFRLEVFVAGDLAILAKFREISGTASGIQDEDADFAVVSVGLVPAEPDYAQMRSARGQLLPNDAMVDAISQAFPAAAAELSPATVAACAQLSRLVGMVVPGLHSVFTAILLKFDSRMESRPGIGFASALVEERYRLIKLNFAGSGVSGTIEAFVRPPPTLAPTPAHFDALALGGKFSGWRAMIVGGSRGLGEVTAKLIAAGGGEVLLTYAVGEGDAERVRNQIDAHYDRSVCSTIRLDVTKPIAEQMAGLTMIPTHIFYFATPQIFLQKSAAFSGSTFDRFCRFYVTAFEELCVHFAVGSKERLNVLYPSSTAVVDRPKGMTEYAMAKAAGEILCADLQNLHPHLRIRAPRLPRTATDQTATVSASGGADPVDIMHPLILEFA